MTTIIVGIGIQGSGKTTILKELAQDKKYVYICPDDIRVELGNSFQDLEFQKKVWEIAKRKIEDSVKKENTIVFDSTFTRIDQRREFIQFLKSIGAGPLVAIFVNTPLEIAKERNRNRERQVPLEILEKYYQRVIENPPSLEDGFDIVVTLDEDFRNIFTVGLLGRTVDVLISDLNRLAKLTVDRLN